MSQEKVDKYKEQKLNRKKDMAKAKRKKKLTVLVGALATVAFVGWLVYSVFAEIQQAKDEESQAAALSSIYAELLQQQATATTGGQTGTGTEATTGGETGTGTETTTGGETGTENSSDNETTSGTEGAESKTEEETTKQ